MLKRFMEWLRPPMTVERGAKCAENFLKENPGQTDIDTAYINGMNHRDDFDAGWCKVLEPHISNRLKEALED